MEEASSADIDSGFVVDPEKVPQLYCATGKTICGDLYFHEECQCKSCDVWKENDLAARGAPAYFCKMEKLLSAVKLILEKMKAVKLNYGN